jgi:hypothetical protein
MIELQTDRPQPQLMLSSYEARDIANLLKFRLQCREEKKFGFASTGFGGGYYIDNEGNYMDDRPNAEIEIEELLQKLNAPVAV